MKAEPVTTAPRLSDCRYLSDRVSTTFLRLEGIANDADDAAKYHAIGDLLDKLAQDVDKPFVTPELTALAKEYADAAKATSAVAHEGASMLSDGVSARRSLGSPEEMQPIMDSIIAHCRGQVGAADCERVVQILRLAGGGASADIERANRELLELAIVTPGLAEDRTRLSAYLGKLAEVDRQGQRLVGAGSAIGERFSRASKQFTGLDVRAKQLCPLQ
jgi:hypothetical protein